MTEKKWTDEYLTDLAAQSLDEILTVYRAESARAAEADADKRAVGVVLVTALQAQGFAPGMAYVDAAGVSAALQTKATTTLDKGKLAALGVDPDVITAATTTTQSAPFVVVRVPKGATDATPATGAGLAAVPGADRR